MSRIEKGSRIKGLPPKIKLNINQDSFFPIQKEIRDIPNLDSVLFDESKIINYGQTIANIAMPFGLKSGSIYLNGDKSSTFFITGTLKKNVVENLLTREYYNSNSFIPFKEFGNPVTENANITSSFYLTGTSVDKIGLGFSEPLSAKSKIEIDITPTSASTISLNNHGDNINQPMAYWNNTNKFFTAVRDEYPFSKDESITTVNQLKIFLNRHTIGFGASYYDIVETEYESAANSIGQPISSFGFPYGGKYEATSSQLISMKKYISEPFLLEKMVIYTNLTFDPGTIILGAPIHYLISFFLLNQKNGFYQSKLLNENYFTAGVSSLNLASYATGSSEISDALTTRDLITWAQIACIPDSGSLSQNYLNGIKRELNIYNENYINGQFMISTEIKNPLKNNGTIPMTPADRDASLGPCYIEKWNVDGRSFYNNGKDWLTAFGTSKEIGSVQFYAGNSTKQSPVTTINELYHKTNPYLLTPEDNLIFGFQLPLPLRYMNYKNDGMSDVQLYVGQGPNITINTTGIHKIVLYGSYLKDNKSFQDIVVDANKNYYNNEFNEV